MLSHNIPAGLNAETRFLGWPDESFSWKRRNSPAIKSNERVRYVRASMVAVVIVGLPRGFCGTFFPPDIHVYILRTCATYLQN